MKTSLFAKKALAILLSIMMLVSMMAYVGISASAETGRDDGSISVEDLEGDDPAIAVVVTLDYGYDVPDGTLEGFSGEPMELPTPERDRFEFAGWFEEDTFDNEVTATVLPDADDTYYAKWVACNYQETDRQDATCTQDGYIEYTCSSCTKTYRETLYATDHNPAEDWSFDEVRHWHACLNDETEKLDVGGHTAGDWEEDTPATCSTPGVEVKKCTVCGYVLDTREIPASGEHAPATEWSSDAEQHWHACANCTEKLDAADHDFGDWTEVVAATKTAKGMKSRTCGTCGYVENDEIPALPSARGTCPDGFTWELETVDGVLTISGSGNMMDYASNTDPSWRPYRSLIKKVVIGKGITRVGKNAFNDGYKYLTEIELGPNVTRINAEAFAYAPITELKLPASCTRIDKKAFYGCAKLEVLDLSDAVKEINDEAFSDCTALTTVIGTGKLNELDAKVFYKCNLSADTLELPAITIIGNRCFAYSKIESVKIGDLMTNGVASEAFFGCSKLTDVDLGNSITVIRDFFFSGCSALESIVIPESVTTLGGGIFQNCTSLADVTLPSRITALNDATFQACSSLTSVTLPAGITKIGKAAFYESGIESIVVPDAVTLIDTQAFRNCKKLVSIDMGNGVKTINQKAFRDCFLLANITWSPVLESIGNDCFQNCVALTEVVLPDSVSYIGQCAFQECTGLTDATIGSGAREIADSAFIYDSALVNLTFKEGVTIIRSGAFWYCTSLQTVVLPDSCVTIGSSAFRACSSLTSVSLNGAANVNETAFKDSTNVVVTKRSASAVVVANS